MILVTGGAGFIGANFVHDWLSEVGEPLVNVDKLTYAGNLANLRALAGDNRHVFVQGDISDYDLILGLLREHRVRAVINFAAESHVDRAIHAPAGFIQTNIVGTYRLLEAARSHCDELPEAERHAFRLLQVSTDEVFGSVSENTAPVSETGRYEPNSPYSATKAAADHLARAWHRTYGLPVLLTNCSNNYGPYAHPEKFIPLLIVNALAGKPLPIYGDGQQVRDWLYVADHCAALRRVLEAGEVGEAYNIGASTERRNIAVAEAVCTLLDEMQPRADGRRYREQIVHIRDRQGHDRRYAIDPRKIEGELGWRPSIQFDEGLRRTVAWYLANDGWVREAMSTNYRDWMKAHYAAAVATT